MVRLNTSDWALTTYDGFDPKYFVGDSAFNLGNSSQTYYENYLLLQKFESTLSSLKYLIIPLGTIMCVRVQILN